MAIHVLKKVTVSILLVLICALFSLPAESSDFFTIGDVKVRPGEMKSGYLQVPEKEGTSAVIPFTVINGAKKGKLE